jgi:hypothetical protein
MAELARKQKVQEQIAAYRELKLEREKQRLIEQEILAQTEREKMD